MKAYQLYFYILIFCFLFIFLSISLKLININDNFKLIIDSIFKFSIGVFIIIFFLNKKNKIDNNDRILFILIGFIILLFINYIKIINIFLKKKKIINNFN
jgi:hypothetical protein